MKRIIIPVLSVCMLVFVSCGDDDNNAPDVIDVVTPSSYVFANESGESTVSFTGQTTRIAMAEELADALKVSDNTEATLLAILAHEEGAEDFSDADLNAASNQIWSKLAESVDYFKDDTGALTAESDEIRTQIEGWISEQATDVFPYWADQASKGVAGQLVQTSGTTRYVNEEGVELDQVVIKSLIGTLMTDQILNDYLSLSQAADNETVEDGETYTEMEHFWDEAYGYLYGLEVDTANPVLDADSYLNKYLYRVESDEDFAGIGANVFNAFALGRAAIVAEDYDLRDEQIEIIRENLSQVIGVRAVHYLASGQAELESDEPDYASAFHSISEGLGFVYSLQFTHIPNVSTATPYFTKTEVEDFISQLVDVEGGLWNANTATTLGELADEIATEFTFTVEETL